MCVSELNTLIDLLYFKRPSTISSSQPTYTVAAALTRAADLTQSDTARLDTELLLAHALEKPRVWLYTWPDKTLTHEQYAIFTSLMHKRQKGEPIAYLLGEQEFWSLPLKVSPSTLIPRCDTERLVEAVLDYIHAQGIHAPKILDLGCGTGAISLALASELPDAFILGVDKIPDAVSLARQNAHHLNMAHTHFEQSDWFSYLDTPKCHANMSRADTKVTNIVSAESSTQFDIIVSNPPYIDKHDVHLQQGDVVFEPLTALVADNNGLADIEHIIQHSPAYLAPQGALFFEHGWQQAHSVQVLLSQHNFTQCETLQDMAGNDRVTLGVYQ